MVGDRRSTRHTPRQRVAARIRTTFTIRTMAEEAFGFLYRSFEEFLADVGPRPATGMSLDRKENNGNYEPGNCRWLDPVEQVANARDGRPLSEYDRLRMLLHIDMEGIEY